MTKQVIEHEIKPEKSVKILLAVLVIGVCANAFAPACTVKDALARFGSGSDLSAHISGGLGCYYGCD